MMLEDTPTPMQLDSFSALVGRTVTILTDGWGERERPSGTRIRIDYIVVDKLLPGDRCTITGVCHGCCSMRPQHGEFVHVNRGDGIVAGHLEPGVDAVLSESR